MLKKIGIFPLSLILIATIGIFPARASSSYNGYGDGHVPCTEGQINIEDYVVVYSECDGDAEIPIGVTSISDYALYSSKLTSITIPSTVKSIGNGAFGRNLLTTLIIPEGVTSVGEDAFAYNQITSLTLPASLKTLGHSAFTNNEISSLTIPDGVVSMGIATFANNNISSLIIGSGLTSLSANLFVDNELTSVSIPNTVIAIENSAFAFNKLKSATIGSGVRTIGEEAFVENQFESIRFLGNAPSIDPGNVFFREPIVAGGFPSFVITASEGSTGWGETFSEVWVRILMKAKAAVKPAITGKALIAKKGTNKLTAKKGTWSGVPTPSISYQWFACTSAVKSSTQTTPKTCKAISKANKSTLSVDKSHKGKYLSVRVIGKSSGSTETTWFSKSSQKVK